MAGVKRGEIRWYRFAAPDKRRPVIVLTRNSVLAYLGEVTVAPITRTVRDIPSEVALGPAVRQSYPGMAEPVDASATVPANRTTLARNIERRCHDSVSHQWPSFVRDGSTSST